MPEQPDIQTVLQGIRNKMATDANNNAVPPFSRTDQQAAQAHVDYLNSLSDDPRLPVWELVATITYSIKPVQPE